MNMAYADNSDKAHNPPKTSGIHQQEQEFCQLLIIGPMHTLNYCVPADSLIELKASIYLQRIKTCVKPILPNVRRNLMI